MFAKFKQYLKEVKAEFKHVNWLTKSQGVKYTLMVIGVSLVMSAFLGLWDLIFTGLLSHLILKS